MLTALPTTDLYFLNSCRGWIARWWRGGQIVRESANCFRAGDCRLLIRRDSPDVMEAALRSKGKLIYVVDDDIDGARQSPQLPCAYRSRLIDFAERYYDRILRRADTIVASSDVLASALQSDGRIKADIVRLDPFWPLPLADQAHFEALTSSHLEILHLGSASHGGALARLAPVICSALDTCPEARLTYIGSPGQHPQLENHPQIKRLNVMSWRRYQRWLPRQRFHLAVYPLQDSPFDRARSANKIFEHAIVGAVGIYPHNWGPASMVAGGAILAPEDPGRWSRVVIDSVKQGRDLKNLSAVAKTALTSSHDNMGQQQVWARLLHLEELESR